MMHSNAINAALPMMRNMITRSPRYQDRAGTPLSAVGRYGIADRALRIFC
jgi:hypothetical protein